MVVEKSEWRLSYYACITNGGAANPPLWKTVTKLKNKNVPSNNANPFPEFQDNTSTTLRNPGDTELQIDSQVYQYLLDHRVTNTHTHTHSTALSGTNQVSRYQKGKPIWILREQETVSGSGIG